MKRIIYIIIVSFASMVSLPSCSEWLDVTPNTDLPAKELFTTENGFNSALAGLYILMTEEDTYGKNLSFGLMEQLVQMYDKLPDGTTDRSSVYIYDRETSGAYNTKGVLANTWRAQYNTIANVNNLLKWWELNGEVVLLDSAARDMIRGEALALRAFLHFDLLRGWG
ncbi:MAG: RagB/SusD family nutrient uptake outer membrane protein, partial [Bacteroidaceae bacterium]|nr:RagB/SusD family nutrient uptake outer membrane protein [Bacteroidaceae bacterium]